MTTVVRSPQLLKLFALATQIGLTRDDRVDLAEQTLRRDITSWSELTPEETTRMLDTLTGYINVAWLMSHQPEGE